MADNKLSDGYIKQQEFVFKIREDYRKELEHKLDKKNEKAQEKWWRDSRFYWRALVGLAALKIIFD